MLVFRIIKRDFLDKISNIVNAEISEILVDENRNVILIDRNQNEIKVNRNMKKIQKEIREFLKYSNNYNENLEEYIRYLANIKLVDKIKYYTTLLKIAGGEAVRDYEVKCRIEEPVMFTINSTSKKQDIGKQLTEIVAPILKGILYFLKNKYDAFSVVNKDVLMDKMLNIKQQQIEILQNKTLKVIPMVEIRYLFSPGIYVNFNLEINFDDDIADFLADKIRNLAAFQTALDIIFDILSQLDEKIYSYFDNYVISIRNALDILWETRNISKVPKIEFNNLREISDNLFIFVFSGEEWFKKYREKFIEEVRKYKMLTDPVISYTDLSHFLDKISEVRKINSVFHLALDFDFNAKVFNAANLAHLLVLIAKCTYENTVDYMTLIKITDKIKEFAKFVAEKGRDR